MVRLTTDKKKSEMNMTELALNSCYVKNGEARYRDYEKDISIRDLARELYQKHMGIDVDNDDDFDEELTENLFWGYEMIDGLIALFYRNLWAMAELREKLKRYEDAEEQGLLLRLPCKVGDTVWIIPKYNGVPLGFVIFDKVQMIGFTSKGIHLKTRNHHEHNKTYILGKTAFLAKEEAEAKLKELKGSEDK